MARSVLEIIICEQDSCARKSDGIKIITLKPEIFYDVYTAFRTLSSHSVLLIAKKKMCIVLQFGARG